MQKNFTQIEWDDQLEDDCRQLVRLAVREDLDRGYDLTTICLIDDEQTGSAAIVARQAGVIAGLRCLETALDEMETRLQLRAMVADGDFVETGTSIAELSGPARDLLTAERLLLNLLGRLSGIATRTRQFVQTAGQRVSVYDTRKTTPGWRRLEKYAVRCGHGCNHRTGLYDAVLIKDNHLALARQHGSCLDPGQAVQRARRRLEILPAAGNTPPIVEVEVDTMEQLRLALAASPDIVLLDNMSAAQLREAVELRDRLAPQVELEASGGINLETVAEVASTGVERISVGGLTHAAVSLDVSLDWAAPDEAASTQSTASDG